MTKTLTLHLTDPEQSGEDVRCESCGGPLCLLGTLVRQTWARCRDCGWDAVFDTDDLEGH